jgi:hypothetical protein
MSLLNELIESQRADDEFDASRKLIGSHFGQLSQSPNVDLDALARSKGICVRRCENIPYEGMIERDANGSATIVLREGLNRRRERFTLAHELGHWLLQQEMLGTTEGRLFRGLSRNESELREEERLANLLAAEILMPCEPLMSSFNPENKIRSLHEICRRFAVSRTAAVRRLADVTNQNILLVQIVPYMFKHLNSLAEIDDAIFASARKGTLFDRHRTRLADRTPFNEFLNIDEKRIRLSTPKGCVDEVFEIAHRPTPIPHVFALGFMQHWSKESNDVATTTTIR